MIRFKVDDSIELRQWSRNDAEAVFAAVQKNYDHLWTFMEWVKPDHSLADYREFIDREVKGADDHKSLGFGIFRHRQLIGTIGFIYFDRKAKVTEIGYWIDADEQGKGIVTRSAEVLVEYAFMKMGMNRVQIRCATDNVRSAAIPIRLGFKLEGIQRQHLIRHGVIYDFAIYGLLASEWTQRQRGI